MARKIKSPNAFLKLIHRFLMLKPVSAVLSKVLHRADTAMLHLSGGRHTLAELVGLPIMQLTTIGAGTDQPRTGTSQSCCWSRRNNFGCSSRRPSRSILVGRLRFQVNSAPGTAQ